MLTNFIIKFIKNIKNTHKKDIKCHKKSKT